ncbi:4'-phosphopantetheinyl transferase family protein [Desulfatitalea alkaliphila]|uniref:4'-phosphopantetheinyl transferase superfamily protein n=1 Tax=Desulfatitalea alkaliphila TaxID=2929485 RepID=A0AA41UKF7_9BACT|nr:4'-phosphopantetheinyl transferase superfamily protein [Desulfatitalea alkaliphila]MCJ8503025.1 4'-phosphopantetheinyl transferase superfamily protein [Desulfatitalea alkaliphila]
MPLLLKKVNNQDVLAVWKIVENETELSRMLTFSEQMHRQLDTILCREKRLEWIASRILLQHLTQCVPCVAYNPNGKPLLPSKANHISISHTKGFAAVLVTGSKPAGIDIEYSSQRIARIAPRFISDQERYYMLRACQDEQICSIIWCAKETLYKVADTPGLSFKRDMYIEPFHPTAKGALVGKLKFGHIWASFFLNYIATADFYLVWRW